MIDEKKIAKTATLYAKETWNHEEEQFVAMCAFKEGTLWAQREFIKTLWHDVKEMPKRAQAFIFECGDNSMNYHIGMMFNPNDYKKNAETWHMNRWCYLSDILPKEGGEE